MVQAIDPAARRGPGRVPPHNLEAEESLLGAMLLSRDAISAATEAHVDASDFYKPAHTHVFEAIMSLYGQGEPVDPVTVADELRRADLLDALGGRNTLLRLQTGTPASANASHYATIVNELALLRRLIAVAGDIAEMGYDDSGEVAETLDRAESLVFEVAERRVSDSMVGVSVALQDTLDQLEALYGSDGEITGVQTGYTDLDELLLGLQPSNLIVVAARPGSGKSAFALGAAANVAMQARRPVMFFSMEMGVLELTKRLLAGEARVDARRLQTGNIPEADWGRLAHAVGRLGETPLYIDDNPHCTVMEMRAKARRAKARHGDLGLIVVDYLQLMTPSTSKRMENRQVEVAEISRGLKILARELDTPVMALSQLNRQLEYRQDKRPMLADLRESGCMPASTRLMRADTGTEVTLGELVLSQEQPLVWSLDEHWRMVPRRLVRAFPSGIKPVFRLRLRSGYEVEASGNHPFRTIDGWRRLDELNAGEAIAVPRRVPEPQSPNASWEDDELILLAHLLGDGTIGATSVKYATADPANKEIVEAAARRLFNIEVSGKKQGNTWQLWFPSPYRLTHGRYHPVRGWLEPLGLWGSRSHNKFVPEEVFQQPNDKIALFLRHLWATDGSITLSRNRRGRIVNIYYATTSRRLADDVRRLLLRMDIRSRVYRARKAGYRDSWHVHVQAKDNSERFLMIVGCHGERGDRVPLALERLATIKPNPNTDLIPWKVALRVKKALEAAGIGHRQIAAALGERYCGSYLLGSAERPRRFSRGRLQIIATETRSEELHDLATSDVYWDEVLEIASLGEMPTFDATVEDTHNFIANGVVAHNSLEQDSDVVIFLYRDEIYNPESEQRGTAEVIVSKHRNGPTGMTRLAFLAHFVKFANMARE